MEHRSCCNTPTDLPHDADCLVANAGELQRSARRHPSQLPHHRTVERRDRFGNPDSIVFLRCHRPEPCPNEGSTESGDVRLAQGVTIDGPLHLADPAVGTYEGSRWFCCWAHSLEWTDANRADLLADDEVVRRTSEDPFPLVEETSDPTQLPTLTEWLDAGGPMREVKE